MFSGTRSLTLAAVALSAVLLIVAGELIAAAVATGATSQQSGLVGFALIAMTAVTGLAMATLGSSHRRHELEATHRRDDLVIDTLQTAFVAHAGDLPGATVGAAQLSASPDSRIGGDTYDVRRIDDRYGYILVADVSGKGIPAAADTAMIKYTAAAYAHLMSDPGEIVAALNHAFIRSRSVESNFVVVFFAIYDSLTCNLSYCAAGPNPAFVRRGERIRPLGLTGPIVGLSDDMAFETAILHLEPGDVLLVATDGLTEARDGSRAMLTEDGAMRWLRELEDLEPQSLANAMKHRLLDFAGGRLEDDLALLTVRIEPRAASNGRIATRASSTAEVRSLRARRTPAAWEQPDFRAFIDALRSRRPHAPSNPDEEE